MPPTLSAARAPPPPRLDAFADHARCSGLARLNARPPSPITLPCAPSPVAAIPQFAESVLKIDTRTQVVSEIGGPFPGASPTGKHKWYGGLLGGDGCIYGAYAAACRMPRAA